MKALTLYQPYAAAIALGLKKYETRSWATSYRGPLAIHTSVKRLSPEFKKLAERYNINKFEYGKIIVVCELQDCIEMTDELIQSISQTEKDFGIWTPGRYAWKLKVLKILKEPIPARGYQMLWNIDLAEEIFK